MKLLIDMNLSPAWVSVFEQHGWHAVHWSSVGNPRANDTEIMDRARLNSYVVFTHDLDFGILLATSKASGPSVIQMRTQDIMPTRQADKLIDILRQYEPTLDDGALITVDEGRSRIRILPI